jgi:hypothetical protein
VKGAARTVLVSDAYWREFLGADADLPRLTVRIANDSYSVVGVLSPGFGFPDEAELWAPSDLDGENPHRTSLNFRCLGRLRDGDPVTLAATAALLVAAALLAAYVPARRAARMDPIVASLRMNSSDEEPMLHPKRFRCACG